MAFSFRHIDFCFTSSTLCHSWYNGKYFTISRIKIYKAIQILHEEKESDTYGDLQECVIWRLQIIFFKGMLTNQQLWK